MKPFSKSVYFLFLPLFLLLVLFSCGSNALDDLEETVIQEKKMAGCKKRYYDNGNLQSITYYVEGKRDSLCSDYYESGVLHLEINYKKGMRDGLYRWYHKTGELYQEKHFSNNLLDGKLTEYYKSGKVRYLKFYKNGQELEGTREFGTSGKELTQPGFIVKVSGNRKNSPEILIRVEFNEKVRDAFFSLSTNGSIENSESFMVAGDVGYYKTPPHGSRHYPNKVTVYGGFTSSMGNLVISSKTINLYPDH